jgi:hypothetical protein
MQQLLQSKGLWKTLFEDPPMFTKEIEKYAYRNKLDEAMGMIDLHVFDGLVFHLDGCKTTKSCWDNLAKSMDYEHCNWKKNWHCLCLMSMHQLNIILLNLGHWWHK